MMKISKKMFNQLLFEDKYKNDIEKLFGPNKIIFDTEDMRLLEKYIYDKENPLWKYIYIRDLKSEYMISNIGEVLNPSGNFLKKFLNKKSYPSVKIFINKHGYTKTVHRLVAEAFITNPENKPQVNHINGIKTCNWVGNLEWVTGKENIQHALKNNLFYRGVGESSNASKYTEEQVIEVCKLLESGKYLNTEISKITKMDVGNISKIKCGSIWKHISKNYSINK